MLVVVVVAVVIIVVAVVVWQVGAVVELGVLGKVFGVGENAAQ